MPLTTPTPALRRRARWAVPAGAASVLAVALVVSPMVADAAPSLPPRTAAELLASTRAAVDHTFSGTVVETARLGLPDLGGAGSTSLSAASLATGSHTARVWYAGPERTRVALVGDLAETDVIRDGRNVWTWSSETKAATHVTLPAESATDGKATAGRPDAGSMTPTQAAQQALAAIDPTTTVRVQGTASVAGRSAYELVLEPKDTRSLVAQVRLAIDSTTSTPLRVEVFARGAAKPAFETAFSSVTFATPAASVFAFSPPPGTKVTNKTMPARSGEHSGKSSGAERDAERAMKPAGTTDAAQPTVIGSGWTTVMMVRGVDLAGASGSAQLSTLLRSAERVSGSYGSGRVLRTALVSALALDDGRLLIGAVAPEVLEQAAASPAAR